MSVYRIYSIIEYQARSLLALLHSLVLDNDMFNPELIIQVSITTKSQN